MEMSKYPVLGTLASIARALGWIAIILGGIVLLVSLSGLSSASSSPSGFMGGILGFVVAIVIAGFGLSLVIVGELIQVFLDIEENTRETVKALSVPGVTVA